MAVSKIRVIIFFIGLGFAIYFGIQLFGPDGTINKIMEAQEQAKIAEQELAEANRELEEAERRLQQAIEGTTFNPS